MERERLKMIKTKRGRRENRKREIGERRRRTQEGERKIVDTK